MLKKFVALCPVVLFLSIFILPTTTPAEETGLTLRVAFYNYMPHIYKDNYGQIRGVAVDLVETMAAREGWRLEYVEGNWDQAMARMDSGEVDIIPSASFSQERAERYNLSRLPFLRSWGAIYFRKNKPFHQFEDLAGHRVAGHQKGQIKKAFQDQARDRAMPVDLLEVEDYDTAFGQLNRGEVDAALVSISYGTLNVGRYPALSPHPLIFYPTFSHILVRRGANPTIIEAVNRHLGELIRDKRSIYHTNIKRWQLDDFQVARPENPWTRRIKQGVGGVLALALVLSGMVFLLRGQVKRKTRELKASNQRIETQLTETTAMKDSLQENERKFSTLIRNLPGLVYRCRNDEAFTLEYLSKASIFPDGSTAPPLTLMEITHDQDMGILRERRGEALTSKGRYELIYRIHDGLNGFTWVSDTGTCIRQGEEITAFEGFISEISSSQEVNLLLYKQKARTRHLSPDRKHFGQIVGQSQAMQTLYQTLTRAAASEDNVLITGESGTGKELVAREIYRHSPRAQGPFITVNCGAIPRELIESEFFGYKKGAFSGALDDKKGHLEMAHQGVLFLDEVGDIALDTQLKLLRALEGYGFTPVGGSEVIKTDIRIIAATNRDMEALVNQGKIRMDFFYRIGVIPVQVPPLRERKEDIPLLMEHFMDHLEFHSAYIPAKVTETFATYDWPGNVRELLNSVKQYITLNTISFLKHSGQIQAPLPADESGAPLKDQLDRLEKSLIQRALARYQGRKKQAAQRLGINRRTLFNKMKKHGLS